MKKLSSVVGIFLFNLMKFVKSMHLDSFLFTIKHGYRLKIDLTAEMK